MHGARLPARNELELDFKQVKWMQAIEFVDSFAHPGAGQGGYDEDHEFFGYRMPIDIASSASHVAATNTRCGVKPFFKDILMSVNDQGIERDRSDRDPGNARALSSRARSPLAMCA